MRRWCGRDSASMETNTTQLCMVALKFDSVATQGIPESRTMDSREWSKTRNGCANLLGINNIIHFHLNETTAQSLLGKSPDHASRSKLDRCYLTILIHRFFSYSFFLGSISFADILKQQHIQIKRTRECVSHGPPPSPQSRTGKPAGVYKENAVGPQKQQSISDRCLHKNPVCSP